MNLGITPNLTTPNYKENATQQHFGMNMKGLKKTLSKFPSDKSILTDELISVIKKLEAHKDPYALDYLPLGRDAMGGRARLIDYNGEWDSIIAENMYNVDTSMFTISKEGTDSQVVITMNHFFSVPKKITKFLHSLLKDMDNNQLEKAFKKQIKIDAANNKAASELESKNNNLINKMYT